jgi:hypothetical protein
MPARWAVQNHVPVPMKMAQKFVVLRQLVTST